MDGGRRRRRRPGPTAEAEPRSREALRTPAFWVFALAASVYGLVASGIALFNESILAERGFAADVYYRSLVVTALTRPRRQLRRRALRRPRLAAPAARRRRCCSCTGALAALPHVSTQAQVMAYAAVMGLAGGFVMVVFFSFWGRAYGRAHLGRIQGAAQILTVLASASGPCFSRVAWPRPAPTRRRSTPWPWSWPCWPWPRRWCRCRKVPPARRFDR